MDEDDTSMYTAVVYSKDREEALSRVRSKAAQYFNTTPDKIRIISESGETVTDFEPEWNGEDLVSTYKDWHFKIVCLCIVDNRPVGIKM